ncbi:MAG: efflux RND transporter periplasmic adaptor subunit, partial [Myxococcales bacterium]|nr:efflux RND transporter periplasmic adaptor subunit [Myxococcales bacterium]
MSRDRIEAGRARTPRRPRVAALLALVLASCAAESKAPAGRGGPPPPVPVRVGRAERKTVPVRLSAIGTVVPIQVVAVRPRVGGQIVAVEFEEGQTVHAGDVLFRIDPRPYEVALVQAEAAVRRDKAQLAYRRTETGRYRTLVEREMAARDQLDQARANVAALEAAIAAGEATVAAARLNLEFATITSPIDGRTGSLLVTAGNVVPAGGDKPLVVIHQLRPIHVSFAVPERELPEIRTRQAAAPLPVEALPRGATAPSRGRLAFVDNTVDPATGTIQLKAVFDNDDESLWPGQFVDVALTLGEMSDVVVVPAAAVQASQEGHTVFVVGAGDVVEVRPVRVLRMDEREAVVGEGLSGGETVVTDGHLRLRPGSRVKIETGGEPGAAG